MKKPYLLLCSFAAASTAVGQSTMYFTAHLTGNSAYTGNGTFSLTTNYFSYDLVVPYGFFQAQVRSPWPDTNAPALFNLSLSFCEPPAQGDSGACYFRWHRTLSDQEIADLQGERWYLTVTANPPFFIEGQILSVPEPSRLALATVGLATICLYRSANKIQKNLKSNHEVNRHNRNSQYSVTVNHTNGDSGHY